MPSQSSHRDYDANLLASAPVATKAQLQSGYNPDLLVEKATPPPSRNDLEARGSSPVERIDDEQPIPIPPKVPYYRTRKGIITIVVVLVVIIAVAVGGGVAGSKKKPTNSSHSQDATTSDSLNATATTTGSPATTISTLASTTGNTSRANNGPDTTITTGGGDTPVPSTFSFTIPNTPAVSPPAVQGAET